MFHALIVLFTHILTLTNIPLDKIDAILQTTFSKEFSWMKKFDFD